MSSNVRLVCPCGGARLRGPATLVPFTSCRNCGRPASEFKEEKDDE